MVDWNGVEVQSGYKYLTFLRYLCPLPPAMTKHVVEPDKQYIHSLYAIISKTDSVKMQKTISLSKYVKIAARM